MYNFPSCQTLIYKHPKLLEMSINGDLPGVFYLSGRLSLIYEANCSNTHYMIMNNDTNSCVLNNFTQVFDKVKLTFKFAFYFFYIGF